MLEVESFWDWEWICFNFFYQLDFPFLIREWVLLMWLLFNSFLLSIILDPMRIWNRLKCKCA